jgi:hypothetical protein
MTTPEDLLSDRHVPVTVRELRAVERVSRNLECVRANHQSSVHLTESAALFESIVRISPDLGRRLRADLPVDLLRGVLERVTTEADGQPMVAPVTSLGSGNWQGRKLAIDCITESAGGVDVDALTFEELIERIECGLAHTGPEDDGGPEGIEHGDVAAESGNFPGELGKSDVLPAGDEVKDGGLHGAEGVQLEAEGQDGKEAA